MRLSKQQSKMHLQAEDIINSDKRLSDDDIIFVIDNWQESANNLNGLSGAFFTPLDLVRDFSVEVNSGNGKVLDLCAGIGGLNFYTRHHNEITCVELNDDYIRVGKRLFPDFNWIKGDVLEFSTSEEFGCIVSNPPFGRVKTSGSYKGKYSGGEFEFRLIDHACEISSKWDIDTLGVFILPQASTPFEYSGKNGMNAGNSEKYNRFSEQTGIEFEFNCGIDTSICINDWKGVSPMCEIVLCEFSEFRDQIQERLFA